MLPIHEVLPPLKEALRAHSAAVLIAEPGAGKSTVAPLELLNEPWAAGGRILLLEPRRLAARAAAARMAASLQERVGDTVGLRVRFQSETSARTRLEVITEGVFTRMILESPDLEGVSAVIFDEFHERSLEADLGLALARESQELLRPDLKLLVMSATLDGDRVSALLGGAPVLTSRGRVFPVETRYLGRDPSEPLEAQTARAVRRALAEEEGGVLVFLPGQAEIRRSEAALGDRLSEAVILAPLYGAMDAAAQDRALSPPPPGRRKVVLATSIAETSLTIEGVRVVVDCGLARIPEYDPRSGLMRLRTVRASRAAVDQRRGRAGRTGPGVCYRMWDAEETRGLAPFATPEILASELSGLALALEVYGTSKPDGLAFLDPPPRGAFEEARRVLVRLGALQPGGGLTDVGRRLGALPLPPRLGRLLLEGAALGSERRAGLLAAVLSERGLGGEGADLSARADRLQVSGEPSAKQGRRLAELWADQARRLQGRASEVGPSSDGRLLLAAFPERLARRRGPPGDYQLISGRGAVLDPAFGLSDPAYVVAAELSGGAPKDRILLAAPLGEAEALEALVACASTEERLEPGPGGGLRLRSVMRAGAFILEERWREPTPEALSRGLIQEVRADGLARLPIEGASRSLLDRWRFLDGVGVGAIGDLSERGLLEDLEIWLAPALSGLPALSSLSPQALYRALCDRIGRDAVRRIDQLAPESFATPAGSHRAIDYTAPGGPRVELRVQELFGLDRHPEVVLGRVPLTLALTSPAGRPIQLTQDLPRFWRGSWAEVRKEMRGRYPRHPWPEDPRLAAPTLRAKPRGT